MCTHPVQKFDPIPIDNWKERKKEKKNALNSIKANSGEVKQPQFQQQIGNDYVEMRISEQTIGVQAYWVIS